MEFLIQFRLRKATELLQHSNLSVLEIASQSGFNNLSNFNRQFKKYYQMTPRQYRKKWHLLRHIKTASTISEAVLFIKNIENYLFLSYLSFYPSHLNQHGQNDIHKSQHSKLRKSKCPNFSLKKLRRRNRPKISKTMVAKARINQITKSNQKKMNWYKNMILPNYLVSMTSNESIDNSKNKV